jgi:single-strand DNA-binding protein
MAADPEVRSMQNGDKVANMTVATSRSWKDKEGNRQEKTQFHRIVIWNPRIVDYVESYLQKGRKVAVTGELEYRRWTDQAGVEKFVAEVVLGRFDGEVEALSAPPASGNEVQGEGRQEPQRQSRPANKPKAPPKGADTRHAEPAGADPDDDIPF